MRGLEGDVGGFGNPTSSVDPKELGDSSGGEIIFFILFVVFFKKRKLKECFFFPMGFGCRLSSRSVDLVVFLGNLLLDRVLR